MLMSTSSYLGDSEPRTRSLLDHTTPKTRSPSLMPDEPLLVLEPPPSNKGQEEIFVLTLHLPKAMRLLCFISLPNQYTHLAYKRKL